MDQLRLRQHSKREYGDPFGYLVELRKLESALPPSVDERLRRLRTNSLKRARESRDAALFCAGMSARLGTLVQFAPVEDQDFDFVTTWFLDDTHHFCEVQLKEVAPHDLDEKTSIDEVLKKLSKYSNSSELTVAVRWNRRGEFDPDNLEVPQDLALGGLWVFGCISPDQSKWALWGDFTRPRPDRLGIAYDYPRTIRED